MNKNKLKLLAKVGLVYTFIILIPILNAIFVMDTAKAYSLSESNDIQILLEYDKGTAWDGDDNGIENVNGVIDFTVASSRFNWNVNNERLCTIWGVLSIESNDITVICNGYEKCCEFIGLLPISRQWNEPFYLYYGRYGAGYNNMVSSRIIYADYSLEHYASYSNLVYSDWIGIPAIFYKGNAVEPVKILSEINAENISLIIYSPDNSSYLTNASGIYLNFSVGKNVTAGFLMDSSTYVKIGNGTEFVWLLNGISENISLSNGQHNITIFLNSSSGEFSFNYSFFVNATSNQFIEAGNCSDGRQNNNEIGIDCGGNCIYECVQFNVNTDKSVYAQNENVQLTVIARANSFVNLTAYLGSNLTYKQIFTPVFSGAPISEQRIIDNTSKPGNYTINATLYYLNLTESMIIYFYVNSTIPTNPLKVDMGLNATAINEGDSILFSAFVSGNTSPVSYRWDFQNDGTIDSGEAVAAYTFGRNATYIVNLSVSDSIWHISYFKSITVRKLFNMTFLIRDNSTNIPVKDVIVDVDGKLVNTSEGGSAVFTYHSGDYNFNIRKTGYITHSGNIELSNNTIIEIALIEADVSAPKIEILGPFMNELITNNFVSIRFKVSDFSATNCKLFFGKSSGWLTLNASKFANKESDEFFSLDSLANGTHNWRIECSDIYGNSNGSEIYTFVVNTSFQDNAVVAYIEEADNNTKGIARDIDSILLSINDWDSDKREIARSLKINELLDKSKIIVQRANRDINSLKWRRLNDTELEKERGAIFDKLEDVRRNIPRDVRVISSTEFIGYPHKVDIDNASVIFLDFNNLKLSKNQREGFISRNRESQSLITVTTKANVAEIEYLSGEKKTITLIHKRIIKSGNFSNMTLFEVIPKEIAHDINDTVLMFEGRVIMRDPVVEVDPNILNEFAYYINREIELKDIENTNSILINKNIMLGRKLHITGFAVLGSGFFNGTEKRLIIEVMVIVILLIVYVVYSWDSIKKIGNMFDRRPASNLKDINAHIEKLIAYLDKEQYDKAKIFYEDISGMFKELPKKRKSELYSRIVLLSNRLDTIYLNDLIDEIELLLDKSKHKEAAALYSTVSQIYKRISPEFKARLLERCIDVYTRIKL